MRGADARLAAAQAAVDNARLQLSYARITAPTAGVIAKRNAETGALVQIGQNLMSIVPDRDVWVTANLKETQLTNVRVGDSVEFTVDAYPGRKFSGQGGEPEPGHRRPLRACCRRTTRPATSPRWCSGFRSKIAVEQPADSTHLLRPGMSVDVDIQRAATITERSCRGSSEKQALAD